MNQSTPSYWIRGATALAPASEGPLTTLDVRIEDGAIQEIRTASGRVSARDIAARGLFLSPGFIDLHVHLREPGQSFKETIASGTAAAAAGGFTSVCCMPNTQPVNDSPAITRWMQSPERGAHVHVFPIAAATLGSMGGALTDYTALRAAGAVAVTDDGKPILEDNIMRASLVAAKHAGLPVIQHAEDTRLTKGAPMNAGATALRLGLRGWPSEAETSIVARDIRLAEETGARLHVAHLSTAGALAAVRAAKARGVKVTCEVTPHHLILHDQSIAERAYDTDLKMNPPLRSQRDREALIAGVFDGTVDAIATDHAPHAAHEKMQEFDRAPFGITGLETALGLCLEELHRKRGLPLARLLALFTIGPASIVGLDLDLGKDQPGRGSLKAGAPADLTFFDPRERWIYRTAESLSKSRNSPFDGYAMQGRVKYTIVAGNIVYRD